MVASKTCNNCGRIYAKDADFLHETSRWRLCDQGNLWFNCSCHSTNMILKGKFPWYSPDLFMGQEAASLFNSLGALKDLPHIPTSVMEIMQLLNNDASSAKQLAHAVKRDPILAGVIVKIANTMKQASGRGIDSLEHAIAYIGQETLHEVIITASLQTLKFHTKCFSAAEFWQESFLTGMIAENLARRFNKKIPPDEAYLAGALANLGKVVMALCFPVTTDKISQDISRVQTLATWSQAEVRYGAPNHGLLGEIAGALWGFPEYVLKAAAHHHGNSHSEHHDELTTDHLVLLANQLTHWILLRPSRIDERLLKLGCKLCGLTQRDLEALVSDLAPLKGNLEAA